LSIKECNSIHYPVLPVEDFVDKVKSMGDEFDDDRSVIEAKKHVIAAANK
jgi:hypothetical protein